MSFHHRLPCQETTSQGPSLNGLHPASLAPPTTLLVSFLSVPNPQRLTPSCNNHPPPLSPPITTTTTTTTTTHSHHHHDPLPLHLRLSRPHPTAATTTAPRDQLHPLLPPRRP